MLLTVADERGNPVATGAQRSEACDIPELTVHGPPRVGRLLGARVFAFAFFSFFRWRTFFLFARRSVLFCSERRTTRAAAGECQYTALSSA